MFLLLHFQRQMNNQETAQIYDKGIFTFFFFQFCPNPEHLNNPGFRRAGYCNDNPGSKLLFEKQRRNRSAEYLFIFNAPGLLFSALKSSRQMLLEVINPRGKSKCLWGCSWSLEPGTLYELPRKSCGQGGAGGSKKDNKEQTWFESLLESLVRNELYGMDGWICFFQMPMTCPQLCPEVRH